MEPSSSTCFEIQSDLAQLEQARKFVRNFCCCNVHWPVKEEDICQIQLAVHEAAVNIIKHAYQNQYGKRILIEAVCLRDRIMFRLNHWGLSFERVSVPPPVFDGAAEDGFGLYIIDYFMDDVQYNFDEDGKNNICIIKNRTAG
jgi:anti-sigma regulatory factor (Ser/Thr protein kinase)